MTTAPPLTGAAGLGDPTAVTPPASVPLGFLGAAAAGLVGFGLITWFGADKLVISPSHPAVVAAVHTGVLAFLTTAVIGALHQFGPVVGRSPIRSVPAARFSLVTMVLTAWMLPNGFAHGPEWMLVAGAGLGAITVTVVAWNLAGSLLSSTGGIPVVGLRMSVVYLVATVAFGVTYVLNRRAGWFPLLPNRVLAHAHLGLIGWLGLTYVSVSQKLWPMFLLAHRQSHRSDTIAIAGMGAGALPLAIGLLMAWPVVAGVGGALVVVGLGAHVFTLASCVRHRRRRLELLHWFLFVSTGFLVAGVIFGLAAALASVDTATRSMLVAAEVAALLGWLTLAIVGHSHKIVPFIVYTRLRSQGVRTHRSGRPLLFGDLYISGLGWVVLALLTAGFGAVTTAILVSGSPLAAVGGVLVALGGLVVTANLLMGPKRAATKGAE